jgi:acetyl-CoA carboxylase biotin carboxylase subunit
MKMFNKVLIANRGEIAVRVMRTCKEMGIGTVAAYSRADEAAAHVLEADEKVLLGESEPSQSYLNVERIIDAALRTGAEAIHPGYGFLAENPHLASRCHDAGIIFIGPPAAVMQTLGNKAEARKIMESSHVPVIPGMLDATQDTDLLYQEAARIGYPVLVKAASGGGGKGMRVVPGPDEMRDACVSAMSEAKGAFGDGSVYLEKLLDSPRHIEFQILADSQGHVLHLFERECSIQRRHQKLIEETPSPAMPPSLREEMGEAAVLAAKSSGYVNAGTVEFLVDGHGQFYFLEVNTRLQVEHPITEMVTGVDIVRLQLEVAAGNPLSVAQGDMTAKGHALECRIYAEDPEAGFRPSPGCVLLYREPAGPGIRIDSGIYEGFEVPMEYDPILGKLIVTAPTREATRRRMVRALENYVILGIPTTIPFLLDVLQSRPFIDGDTSTGFIERHFDGWRQDTTYADLAGIAFVVDEMSSSRHPTSKRNVREKPTPWQRLGDWRL